MPLVLIYHLNINKMKDLYIAMFGLKVVNEALALKKEMDEHGLIDLFYDVDHMDEEPDKKTNLLFNIAKNIEFNNPLLDLNKSYYF